MRNINWRVLYNNTIGMSMILVIICAVIFEIPFITVTFYGLTREGSRYIIFVWAAWVGGLLTLRQLICVNKQRSMLSNVFGGLLLFYICIVFVSNLLGLDFATSILGSAWRHQGYILLLCCGLS